MKKYFISAGAMISGLGTLFLAQFAHAQFAVASSTEQVTNGGYLTTAYTELVNMLSNTGVVTFLIITTILAIVVWLAVNRLRHIFSA